MKKVLVLAVLTIATLIPKCSPAQVINACVDSGGNLKVLTPCPKGYTPLSWNIQGPQGPQGPQGVPGPQGAPGVTPTVSDPPSVGTSMFQCMGGVTPSNMPVTFYSLGLDGLGLAIAPNPNTPQTSFTLQNTGIYRVDWFGTQGMVPVIVNSGTIPWNNNGGNVALLGTNGALSGLIDVTVAPSVLQFMSIPDAECTFIIITYIQP